MSSSPEKYRKKLSERIMDYREYGAYLKDAKERKLLVEALDQATDELAKGSDSEIPHAANSAFQNARAVFLQARFSNRVFKYKSKFGGWSAAAYFLIAAILWVLRADLARYLPIPEIGSLTALALIGGLIGGVAVVASRLMGLDIQTNAAINQVTWYIFKPPLSAVMGAVSFLVLYWMTNFLDETALLKTKVAAFLIGFISGYLESFATAVLTKAADALSSSDGGNQATPKDKSDE